MLNALFDRFFALDTLSRIPQLYDIYAQNVTTNLDLSTVISLSQTALKLTDKSRISNYYINNASVSEWVTPGGAQVLLPKFGAIRQILNKALNAP